MVYQILVPYKRGTMGIRIYFLLNGGIFPQLCFPTLVTVCRSKFGRSGRCQWWWSRARGGKHCVEQRGAGHKHEGRAEAAAAAGRHQGADDVPGVPGQAEEHDLPVRPRHLPDVRGQDVRVSHL